MSLKKIYGHQEPCLTYCSGGSSTTNPDNFFIQFFFKSFWGSVKGEEPSHTSWIYEEFGSQKGFSNSSKILLLVPNPNFFIACILLGGKGGLRKSSACFFRNPEIINHNNGRLMVV